MNLTGRDDVLEKKAEVLKAAKLHLENRNRFIIIYTFLPSSP